MGFVNFLFGKQITAAVEKMSAKEATMLQAMFFPKWSYTSRRSALGYLELFHTSPRLDAVYMAAEDVANSTYKVYRKKELRLRGESAEAIIDHPVYDVLENPMPHNPEMDGFVLRFLTEVYTEINGECFWVIVKDVQDNPREIYPLPTNWCVSTPTMAQPFFRFLPLGNTAYEQINVDPSCVVWWKNPDITTPYGRGRGRVEAIGDEIETDEYASKFQKNIFFNDARPPGVLALPGASEDSVKNFRERWNQAHQGFAQAYKMGFTGTDAKFINMMTSLRELDFTNSRNFLRDAADQHFMVPPELRGILENSNRATIESSFFLWNKNVISKRLKRFDAVINRQLMPMWDAEHVIQSDNIVPQDEQFALTKATTGWQSGLLKKSEARKILNLPWDPKEKDAYFEPSSGFIVPARGDVPAPELDMGKKPEKPVEQDEDVLAEEATQGNSNLPVKQWRRTKAYTPEEKAAHWQRFDKAASGGEKSFVNAVGGYAKDQAEEFQQAFDKALAGGKSQAEAVESAVTDVLGVKADTQLRNSLIRSWIASMRDGMFVANTMLSDNVKFDAVSSVFKEWVEEFGLEKAKGINGTTKEEIKTTLAEGIGDGESIDDLRRRIEDTYDGLSGYRAERIARTETIGSVNFGSTATYKAAGVEKKEWISTNDDRTREAHDEVDGQIVGMDDPFLVGGDELQYPGDPSGSAENVINCRCTTAPVVDLEGESE